MITNQATIRPAEEAVLEGGSPRSPREYLANPTERVIAAYIVAARRRGGTQRPFDAAVDVYMACYPATRREAATRIVADIITHRS